MEIFLYFFFVIVFATVVLLAYHKRYHTKKTKDYLDLFSIFSLAYFLYTSVGTLDRVGMYSNNIFVPGIVYLSIVVGYIAFQRGYIKQIRRVDDLCFPKQKIRLSLFSNSILKRKNSLTEVLLVGSFLLFMIINFEQMKHMVIHFGSGVSYVQTSIRAERTAFSGPLSLLSTYFTLFMIGLPTIRICKSGKISLLDIFLLVVLGMYSIASGHRNTLLIIGFAVLAVFNYRHGYINIIKLGAIGLSAMFFFVALGHLRASSDIVGMIHRIADARSYMLKLTSSGEFYNTVGTFYEYIGAIHNGSYYFNYGYSWVVDILIFIPTFLFPSRPLPWSEQFMRDFYPNAPRGTGHGWFILNNGYMAFGIIGLVLEMYIVGVVLAKVYIFFKRKSCNPIIVYIYVIILSYVFLMTRTGFLQSLKNVLLDLFPFILLYYFSETTKIKGRKFI